MSIQLEFAIFKKEKYNIVFDVCKGYNLHANFHILNIYQL